MTTFGLSSSVWEAFQPRPRLTTWEWISTYGRSSNGKEPFDLAQLPYLREVADQFDNPLCELLVLCWGARTGKTAGSHNCLLSKCALDPQEMMIALPTEALLVQQIEKKLYRMAEKCAPLKGLVPVESKRNKRLFEFGGKLDVIYGVWSGSTSQLADRSVRYLDCEEVDKFSTEDSEEGDTLDQVIKRTHDFPDRKIFLSGTPRRKAGSRIERWLRRGTNSRYWIPCGQCGEHQTLKFSLDGPRETGLVFDSLESGEWDHDQAMATARYVCEHCRSPLNEVWRFEAEQRGVWAPRGCSVDREGQVVGTPVRRGAQIWSSRLSALYALNTTFGAIACWWIDQHTTPPGRRVFSQLTLGKGYEPEITQLEPGQLGERIGSDVRRGVCPKWTRVLAVAADVQKEFLPFLVIALGENCRTHIVDYGQVDDPEQLFKEVLAQKYEVQEAEPACALQPNIVGIDSSYRTSEIYAFCQEFETRHQPIWPIKGSDTDMQGKPWAISILGVTSKARRGPSRQFRGKRLLWLNTDYWEEIMHSALCDLQPADSGYLTLCREACEDFAFLSELLNATQDDTVTDKRGNARRLWIKREREKPNNYRDCLKMSLCLLDLYLDKSRGRLPAPAALRVERTQQQSQDRKAPSGHRPQAFSGPFSPRPSGWVDSLRHVKG